LSCGTWDSYDNRLCFKAYENPGSLMDHSAAEKLCEDKNSVLLQIKSAEEQRFFSSFLFQNRSIFENVWLGGHRKTDGAFTWTDNIRVSQQTNYSNWLSGHPLPMNNTGGTYDCMQMERYFEPIGKWISVPCTKLGITVCLKTFEMDHPQLRHEIMILQNETKALQTSLQKLQADTATKREVADVVSTLGNEIQSNKDNPVPKGFIYVQFHNQATPSYVWPGTKWEDITSGYAGHFFRALGRGAAAFGTSQGENFPRLTQVNSELIKAYSSTEIKQVSLPVGGTSGKLWTGDERPGIDTFLATSFTTSGGEVRPKNYGIRIWKRI
jgi:hypothetical protein